ncbi:glycosyltransferase [Litoribacter ruber]|uniref:glycosyltransferase n=1 Tax=Litoribacter ruber TaxID=702568 RepID=UPI001BDA00F8|nr:glycosyltransferase [Litoribacter ruber]MBT0812616.1 glycosyltransferase [Litoribacter ruber]
MQELKKVLIITYYWPPSAGSGVQRWLKFAKYLPQYGWEPVVFTPENPDFELRDMSLLKEIPRDLEVLKFPIWEPYGIFRKLKGGKIKDPSKILEKGEKGLFDKLSIWMRANLLIPDPRRFWVKPSVEYLSDILEKNKIETVITTGPPHSLHLIGRNLKRKLGVRWVADFRDPWSSWEFLDTLPMTPLVRKQHEELERSVLKEADRVLTISPTFQEEISKIYPRSIDLITNGFDQADLPAQFAAAPEVSKGLKIVYTGIIDAIRDPLPFLKALRQAFEGTAVPVEMTFVGKVSDKVIHFIESDEWLANHVHFAGYVSHEEVFGFYEQANLLLLILTKTKNAKGNIPGKIFEYMATERPVLALGDPAGDSAQILQAAQAGKVFAHKQVDEIKSFLLRYAKGEIQINSGGNVKKYDRKELTKKLAAILDEL